MKKAVYYLMMMLPMVFICSCNDEGELEGHNCKLPIGKEYEGSVEENGVVYDLYSCVPYYYDNDDSHLAVLSDYAFVEYVASSDEELEINSYIYGIEYMKEYDVAYINSSAFKELKNLERVSLPHTVLEIYGESKLFSTTPCLKEIYCYCSNPVEVESEDLGCDYQIVTLHVKKGKKVQWQTVEPWSRFKNIVEDL